MLLTTHYSLLTTHYSRLTTHDSRLTAYHLLLCSLLNPCVRTTAQFRVELTDVEGGATFSHGDTEICVVRILSDDVRHSKYSHSE